MSLPGVVQGAPHVAAHNAERVVINANTQAITELNTILTNLVITNLSIIEDPDDPGFAILEVGV